MLRYKAWRETRARFITGFVIMLIMAFGMVLGYPAVRVLPTVQTPIPAGPLGRVVQEALDLSRTFQGYIYSQWFRQNLPQMAVLFAIIIGSGNVYSRSRGALYTLSLPASRTEVLRARMATGLLQLLVLAFLPSLVIPVLAPAIGESQGIADVLLHGVSVFIGATAFFGLAMLLSSMSTSMWPPILISCGVVFVVAFCEAVLSAAGGLPFGIFKMMSGDLHFTAAALPWISWVVTAIVSALLLWTSARVIEQRDF